MADRLTFSESAQLTAEAAEAMAACLVTVLGPAMRGYPSLGLLVATLLQPKTPVVIARECCLDVCVELLECSSRARRRGRDVDAYTLEGVEACLLDALVASTATELS